jgi:long-chain acyl-CoA synthetase
MAAPGSESPAAGPANQSFAGLVQARALEQPSRVAFRYKSRGIWHDVSWADCAGRMSAVAAGLARSGVRPGDCVAVAAPASPAWLFAVLGVHAAGAQPLSVYQGLPPDDLAAVFAGQHLKAAIAEIGWLEMLVERSIPLPETVVLTDSQRPAAWSGGPVVMLSDFDQPSEAGSIAPGLEASSPAFLFATAGTGGAVRVVAHSTDSLLAAARAIAEPLPGRPPLAAGDTTVVELPTGHVGALLAAIVLPQAHGLIAHLPETKAADAVRDVHPTLSLNLAGAWERMAARVQVAAAGTGGVKGFVFRLAQRTRRPDFGQAGVERSPTGLLTHLAYAAVFFPLLSKLGVERLKAAYVVGVTSPDELSLWRAWGVDLVQAYGLTEAGPVVARLVGTTLVAAAGSDLKLGPAGDVLVRGASVCAGYRSEGRVQAARRQDGWLETGDVGVEHEGGIRVLGARHDIHQSPAGPVPLTLIDAVLRYSPYIRAAITTPHAKTGDLEAYVDCDFASLARWATSTKVTYRSPAALLESDAVARLFEDEKELTNRRLERRSLPTIGSIAVAAARLGGGVITPIGSVRRATARGGDDHRRHQHEKPPAALEPRRN